MSQCYLVSVEEMKLREPKNDAQRSNHVNVLLTMAEGGAKRDAWRQRTKQRTEVSQCSRILGNDDSTVHPCFIYCVCDR